VNSSFEIIAPVLHHVWRKNKHIIMPHMSSKTQDIHQAGPPILVRDVWKGRHTFHTLCCNITVMKVVGQKGPWFTFISLVTGVLLHLIAIEPYFAVKTYFLSTVVVVALWFYALYVFLCSWLSDPGILPRKQSTYRQKSGPYRQSPPNPQYVCSSGRRVKLSYCSTCEMYQPPRTAHCIMSDSCVMRFDHFCPWIGNTVGLRNYKYFFRFLISGGFLLIDIVISCVARIVAHVSPKATGDENELVFIAAIFILIFAVIFFCFIVGMIVFHSYLQATNQTTYENVNSRWINGNPHGYGWDIFMELMTSVNHSKFPANGDTNKLIL